MINLLNRTMIWQSCVYFRLIALFVAANFVVAQDYCDPIDEGTNAEIVRNATINGELNPNACLCTYPCTVDKVGEFVQFYFTKR